MKLNEQYFDVYYLWQVLAVLNTHTAFQFCQSRFQFTLNQLYSSQQVSNPYPTVLSLPRQIEFETNIIYTWYKNIFHKKSDTFTIRSSIKSQIYFCYKKPFLNTLPSQVSGEGGKPGLCGGMIYMSEDKCSSDFVDDAHLQSWQLFSSCYHGCKDNCDPSCSLYSSVAVWSGGSRALCGGDFRSAGWTWCCGGDTWQLLCHPAASCWVAVLCAGAGAF